MPGIASHLLLAEEIADRFGVSDSEEIVRVINNNRSYYLMGSIGPDLFFFAPDLEPWVADLLRISTRTYDEVFKPAIRLVDEFVAPIETALDDVEDFFTTATCGLIKTFEAEADALASALDTLGTGVIATATASSVNVFDEMVPPIQKGEDVDSWYWFDVIHYRHTGELITNMWDRADTDAEKAFVLGWVTHHAADVIGHATVNALVGGPYRSHNQRHHFIENLMDVDLWDRLRDVNLVEASLHLSLPGGEAVERETTLTTLLDQPNDPDPDVRAVLTLLSESIRETYDAPPNRISGGYLDVEQLNAAYVFTLVGLKTMTSSTIEFPPDPTAEALAAIEEAWNDFMEEASAFPEPPALPPDLCAWPWEEGCSFDLGKLDEWIGHLWNSSVGYLGEVLAWVGKMMEKIYQLGACTFSAPFKVTIRGVMWTARAAVYEFQWFIREALAMLAVALPDRTWLHTHPIAQESLQLSPSELQEATGMTDYPHRSNESNAWFLQYPTTHTETEPTLAAPVDQLSALDQMIDGVVPNETRYEDYSIATSPHQTRTIQASYPDVGFGSIESMARDIMTSLADGSSAKLPNWNMDADRGYGYLAWKYGPDGEVSWA